MMTPTEYHQVITASLVYFAAAAGVVVAAITKRISTRPRAPKGTHEKGQGS